MRVIPNKLFIPVDVDGTLILPVTGDPNEDIVMIDCPYAGDRKVRAIHRPHVKALKQYIARGAHVLVWSKNGCPWAVAVIKALGLDHLPLDVSEKPLFYVDDMPAEHWIGERLFIQPYDTFGDD